MRACMRMCACMCVCVHACACVCMRPYVLVDLQHHGGGVEVHVELVHQNIQPPDLLCHGVGHLAPSRHKHRAPASDTTLVPLRVAFIRGLGPTHTG